MKVLELFAGTRSIGKAFEAHSHQVFSVEWDKSFENIDLYEDVLKVTPEEIVKRFGRPDVIWASPDCTTYSMAIFLCAFLANVVFSLWYNIKINREPFSREKLATGGLKALTFIVGLTLLCIAITTLPIFATEVGWTIPEEYAELFADLIIVGAVLLVACKYIKEAFTKFVAILNTPADIAPEKEGIDHEQQPVSNVFQDQSAPDQPQES